MNRAQELLEWTFFKGYRVNENGEVITPKGKVRKLSRKVDNRGTKPDIRFTFNMKLPGQASSGPIPVHRLAAYQKFGDKMFKKGIQVRHLDGDSTNNKPDNTDIGSPSVNAYDRDPEARRLHAQKAGQKMPHYKGEEFWDNVRADHESGMGYKKLRKKYGVALSALSYRLSKTAKRRSLV